MVEEAFAIANRSRKDRDSVVALALDNTYLYQSSESEHWNKVETVSKINFIVIPTLNEVKRRNRHRAVLNDRFFVLSWFPDANRGSTMTSGTQNDNLEICLK